MLYAKRLAGKVELSFSKFSMKKGNQCCHCCLRGEGKKKAKCIRLVVKGHLYCKEWICSANLVLWRADVLGSLNLECPWRASCSHKADGSALGSTRCLHRAFKHSMLLLSISKQVQREGRRQYTRVSTCYSIMLIVSYGRADQTRRVLSSFFTCYGSWEGKYILNLCQIGVYLM